MHPCGTLCELMRNWFYFFSLIIYKIKCLGTIKKTASVYWQAVQCRVIKGREDNRWLGLEMSAAASADLRLKFYYKINVQGVSAVPFHVPL